MIRRISAEEWEAEFDAVKRRYRQAVSAENVTDADKASALASAISDLHKLGVSSGEAVQHLKPHLRGK